MLDELAMRTAVSDGRVLRVQIVGCMRSAENVPSFLLRHNALSFNNATAC